MNRQRGLGTIGLIIYVVMAAAVLAAVYGAYRFVVNIGVAEMRAKWSPIIDKCEGIKGDAASCLQDWQTAIDQRAQAVAANQSLRDSLDGPGGLKEQVAACNKAVDDAKAAADAARAERLRAMSVAKTALDAVASDKRLALARADAPAQGGCEEVVARQVAGLAELAQREIRDRPPLGLTVELVEPKPQIAPGSTPAQTRQGRAPDPRRDRLEVGK